MRTLFVVLFLTLLSTASAHDYVPGRPQSQPILLKGGDLNTVSHGVLEATDLLFAAGRITEIGKDLALPPGGRVIDVSGQQVYPGLIAPWSGLGLVEIGAVRATVDLREVGQVHPEVMAHIAYNTDSEIIPTVRANGITTALVVPQGGIISGRSSLMNLDGWNSEDASEKLNVGLHVNWPRQRIVNAWWMEKTADEQKKENAKNRKRLGDTFDAARSYYLAKQANPDIEVDTRWEAMLPVFSKSMPVFIHAGEYRQIEQAVAFAKKQDIRVVLVGGSEAYRLADLLVENDIPVILSNLHSTPMREDDDYDLPYRLPSLLADAGVEFCISSGSGATGTMNLPFQGGQAVGYGLDPDVALRALTLSPAEILGVEGDLGSLEVGKKATLVVSRGDIMDVLTNAVTHEFIEGKEVDLNSRHVELYQKYRARQSQH
ncbi:MAG: amidohydrolase family protein [candidate division Zixibacteria bacterium]|nr:amidohydrolase family protein [candidate division Zixibacteria bacterium]MDH3938720.1 amidohydrolase family protein [candidate division Zixibacteria bacterium]MDH4034899.1 amidohydrolase family protein [candidate division Zixibacteria bacterium]